MQFQNPNRSQAYLGQGPERFTFNRNIARVYVASGTANQQMVNYAKSYVEMANKQYAEMVAAENQKRILRQRAAAQEAIRAEEERARILASLKI